MTDEIYAKFVTEVLDSAGEQRREHILNKIIEQRSEAPTQELESVPEEVIVIPQPTLKFFISTKQAEHTGVLTSKKGKINPKRVDNVN